MFHDLSVKLFLIMVLVAVGIAFQIGHAVRVKDKLDQIEFDLLVLKLETELLLNNTQPLPNMGGGIDSELLLRYPHGGSSL